MSWLNYHHLYYFWCVAHEGSIAAASRTLRLAPSTLSEQIKMLEGSLEQKLFKRSGRNLVLTATGQATLRYADDIFNIGRELQEYISGRKVDRLHLNVGLSMVVPKQIAARLLRPAFELDESVHLVCREGGVNELLADLATHHLDIVITDAPLGPERRVRAFNHLLAQSNIVLVATPELAASCRDGFPQSLNGVEMLVPTRESATRRHLDRWLDSHDVHPHIQAEFDDHALLKVFGQLGHGVFPIPSLVKDEVIAQYGVEEIAEVEGVVERYYGISVERRLRHPAVIAISDGAVKDRS